jgi:hypothetical protein
MILVMLVTCPSQMDNPWHCLVSNPVETRERIKNLRMSYNKEMTMLNLSNVIHTCVYGASNEHATSTTASMVGLGSDAYIGVEALLLGRNNCKTTYNQISI